MELEALIVIPVLVFLGALTYLYLVGRQTQFKGSSRSKSQEIARSTVAQYDIFKVLYAGVIIMIIMVLTPWFIFYVRSGARLSFITDYLTILFILSILIFPCSFYYIKKRNEA